MPVALIGLPGSGKSAVGAHLAGALGVPFVDCDHAFEAEAGCSIAAFFKGEGVDAFRTRESLLLERLLSESGDSVIATGGGVVMSSRNRAILKEAAACVWLRCTPFRLLARLAGNTARPLLQNADPAATLARLLEEREPFYREIASHVIDIDGEESIAEVSASIARIPAVAKHRVEGRVAPSRRASA